MAVRAPVDDADRSVKTCPTYCMRKRNHCIARRLSGYGGGMSVTSYQDLSVADRDHDWDGAAAEKRVRAWADAEDEPNEKYRIAHVWYDGEKKDNFTAYK